MTLINKHKHVGSWIMILVLLFNMFALLEPVFAGVDGIFFSGIRISKNGTAISDLPNNLTHGDTVRFEFDWKIANTYENAEAEILKHKLPETIKWSAAGPFDLEPVRGKSYGTWEIEKVGDEYFLKLVFAGRADAESEVHGSVTIDADIDIRYKTIELPYQWDTTINGAATTELTFDIDPDGGAAITKSGARDGVSEFIDWTIDVNTNLQRLTSPVVTDEYSSLLKYTSFSIVYLIIDSEGNVVSEGLDASGDLDSTSFTDADGLTMSGLGGLATFNFKDTNKAYRIKLKTEIDPTKIDYNQTDFTYGNRVKLDNNSFIPQVDVNISRGNLITKSSTLEQANNADSIDWEIRVNNAGYNLANVFVEDTLPTGLTYRDIVIKDTEVAPNTLVLDTDYKVNPPTGGETFTFEIEFLNPVTKEYVITYTTDVADSSKANNDTTLSFANAARLRHSLDGSSPKVANHTATMTKGKLIDKLGNAVISYDDAKYIDWTIYVNMTEIDLGGDLANRTVTDTMSNNEYLTVPNSIEVAELTLDGSGNVTATNDSFADYTISYYNGGDNRILGDDDINKFEVIFNNEISKPYKITYRTVIQNHDITSHTNDVKVGPYSTSATTNPTIENVFSKSRVGAGIDYINKDIEWLLTVNPIKEAINGLTITDTIPTDQYLSLAEFNSLLVKRAGNKLDKKVLDPNDVVLSDEWSTVQEDYIIKQLVVDQESFNGVVTDIVKSFEISFPNTVNNASYTVEYKTSINPNTHGNALTYTNTGTFDWTGNVSSPLNKSDSPDLNDTASQNGRKVGSIDGSDKRQINWMVDVNYFSKDISDNVLTDNLPAGLILVPGSVEVYNTSLDGSGNIVEGGLADNTVVIDETTSSFTVTFNGNHYSPYRIKYDTKIDGVSKASYTNTASLSNGETFTDTVNMPNYNEFVSKTSNNNGTTSVDYALKINESHSVIDNLVIKDTLSAGLEIVMSSFEITDPGMTFADYFDVTIEDKTLVTNPTVVVMTAKSNVKIDKEFTITYTANIIEEDVIGKKVSNNVKLTGNGLDFGTKSATVEEDFTSISGFGTGSGEVGSFTLTKVDKDDNTIKLSGAEYELKRGDRVLGTLVTNENGQITLGNLLYLEHTLTETKAPEGYKLDATPHKFTVSSTPYTVTLENEMDRSIKIKKVDNNNVNQVLEGAVFELYDDSDVLIDTLTTDEMGLVSKIVAPGDYKVVEIKAPNGYYLDATPQTVTVDTSSAEFELIVKNRRIPTSTGPIEKEDPKEPEKEEKPKEEEKTEEEEPVEEPEEKVKEKTTEDEPASGTIEIPEGSTPKVEKEPDNGTVEIDEDGQWTYTPDPDFEGEDSFTIRVENEDGTEEIIYFEIEVEETPLGFVELPQTGDQVPWFHYIIGSMTILLGVFILKKRR